MPVRHAAQHERRITGMKLLHRMPLHLGARHAFFAKQYLASLVYVPLGARAGFEVNARRTHVNVAFETRDSSREICVEVGWLLSGQDGSECAEQQTSATHLPAAESSPKASKTLPGRPPRAG
jgi:hypothetical protein